jgi:membrane-associated protease RseP (regulator of RpoE activity)
MERDFPEYTDISAGVTQPAISKAWRTYSLHTLLFLATFFTTTLAGVQWLNKDPTELGNFALGLPYSLCLLTVLSAHEFGHFFAAKYHQVKTTLPYYIPIPPFLLNPFGTMGAVIRIKSPLTTKKALFDIGIAGPLAGLVPTVIILMVGFLTLPSKEYLYSIHPEYRVLDKIPDAGLTFGYSALFWLLAKAFSATSFVPPMNEIYHYPFLCVGWFGLFITALNLIPVGQLDGGHILYALVGRKQGMVARVFFVILILIGASSFLPLFGPNIQLGTAGWLVWAGILFFLIKLDHPPVEEFTELSPIRKQLGWFTFLTFLLTFPPIPLFEVGAR